MSIRVSIIVPVIDTEKAERCLDAIERNTGLLRAEVQVISRIDINRIGCPEMVNRLVAECESDVVCFVGDDCIPQPGFMTNALEAMATLPDGWGVVGLNDGVHPGAATHWLADKRMLPLLGGEFIHTGYKHCFCDNELQERATAAGRYIWAENAKLIHDNPVLTGQKTYDAEMWKHDEALFFSRRPLWQVNRFGKVAIGVRLARVSPHFLVSWSKLLMAGTRPGDVVLSPPIGLPHSIAANWLVAEFRNSGCDSLLFIDDDMVFEADVLENLRKSQGDFGIVSALFCCRRYPNLPVTLRHFEGDEKPKAILDLDGVVDVDYCGLAFTLVRGDVIEAIAKDLPNKEPFAWNNSTGEDGDFCIKARSLGYKVGVNTDVKVGHRVEFTATWDKEKKKTVMSG